MKRRIRIDSVVAISLIALFGCSSTDSDDVESDRSATEATVAEVCNARCTISCHCSSSLPAECTSKDTPAATCVSDCLSTYRVRAPRVLDLWLRNQASCIREHIQGEYNYGRCLSINDDCEDRYILADPAFPNIPIVQKCHGLAARLDGADNKGKSCVDEGRVPSDCNALATLTESARRDADAACLGGDKTCKTLDDCLDAALGY